MYSDSGPTAENLPPHLVGKLMRVVLRHAGARADEAECLVLIQEVIGSQVSWPRAITAIFQLDSIKRADRLKVAQWAVNNGLPFWLLLTFLNRWQFLRDDAAVVDVCNCWARIRSGAFKQGTLRNGRLPYTNMGV